MMKLIIDLKRRFNLTFITIFGDNFPIKKHKSFRFFVLLTNIKLQLRIMFIKITYISQKVMKHKN